MKFLLVESRWGRHAVVTDRYSHVVLASEYAESGSLAACCGDRFASDDVTFLPSSIAEPICPTCVAVLAVVCRSGISRRTRSSRWPAARR